MVKVIVSGLFGFMIGLSYGIYLVVNPEESILSGFIHLIAKLKGLGM